MASKKGTVAFTNTSAEVKKTMEGLAKTALRASGKVIRKYLREEVPIRTKRFKNHIASWVMINRQTGQPTLQIGFYSWQKVKKRGKKPSHASPWWIEYGTNEHFIEVKNKKMLTDKVNAFGRKVQHPGNKATHVLRNTVADHVKEIRAAQEQYLSELSKTLEQAGVKVDPGDEFEDDD